MWTMCNSGIFHQNCLDFTKAKLGVKFFSLEIRQDIGKLLKMNFVAVPSARTLSTIIIRKFIVERLIAGYSAHVCISSSVILMLIKLRRPLFTNILH